MQLPNRDQLESSFAVRFTRLNARLRHQLENYLGYPPDVTKVPESFWQEVESEMQRELAIVLLLIWSQSAIYHGLDAQGAQAQGAVYAAQRAATVAPQFAANTRDMLQRAAQRWAELPEPPTRSQVQTDVVVILGPRRAERTATTETTKAQTDGGEAGVGQTVGVRDQDLWMTREDARVCPICLPLHGQPRSVWQAKFPQGPGDDTHVQCRCFIQYAVDLSLPKGVSV